MKIAEMLAATSQVDSIDEALRKSDGSNSSPRLQHLELANALQGDVLWKPGKSLWMCIMTMAAVIGGPIYFTFDAFALFLATSALTLCLGHSLGVHRGLIHRSFQCPRWLERLFVYFGVIVGMAGPFGMIRQHEIRDWAQREPSCHSYLSHAAPLLTDLWRQLNCELRLTHPPKLVLERSVSNDWFYLFLERTWMAQQIPWAILFYAIGGMPWLTWGIAVRVVVSVSAHWIVVHIAHNRGERSWHLGGAGVQGYNVPSLGLISMGEAWHNNHHAFPASARIGLYEGEIDPGWHVLKGLEALGLVWNLKTPETLPPRHNLIKIAPEQRKT